jgi:DNA-directed RNA polymerase specialized sigma24 family protein
LILQLRYEEAASLAEVAEMVHVSVGTVKNSLRASLERLRTETGREEGS